MAPEYDLKHILYAPSWYPNKLRPHNGSFFREQALMLKKADYEVGVVALDCPLLPLRWDLRLHVNEENGVIVIRSKIPQTMSRNLPGDATISRHFAIRALKKYEELNGKPDIVHAHSVFPGIYVAKAASDMWGIPYVLTEHRPWYLRFSSTSPRGKTIVKAVREANARAAVSKPFADKLAEYYDTDEWDVIALPSPDTGAIEKISTYNKTEPFVFLHISYWGKNKRVELTLRAFADAYAKNKNIRLKLVGGAGEELEKMIRLRDALGLNSVVEISPRQPRDKIASLMSNAHCFVLLSAVEAGGTVFAEAQIAGLPCIASKTFAGQFMVEPETGIQVAIDDQEAVTSAMLEIAADAHHKYNPQRIRKRAIERFSEETFVTTNEDLYAKAFNDFYAAG